MFPFRLPILLSCLCLGSIVSAAVERRVIDHDFVREIASEIVKEPYEAPREQVTAYFRKLSYDDYRRIRFLPEASLWRGDNLPFQVQFFHPGYLFNQTVELHEFTSTHTQPIPFSAKFFDYQDLKPSFWSRRGLNYAGFRVISELNQPGKWDEVISFLGASYFRALGRNHRYGISARGLSINAGGPAAEEFPHFIEFWLGKPEPMAKSFTIHALLDGASVTGAYTFVVTPGDATVVDVRATLFFRRRPELPGLAPMSSMYWFGENSATRYGDFRPEVHDSDGLLVAPDAATRVWRPLGNPAGLTRTEIPAPALGGFGLLQRDRDLRNYEDYEALYNLRPGLWVEALGQWPAGRVHLVEMPAANEYHDNIVAFWSPAAPVEPGKPLELAWRLHWTNAATFGGPAGWVRSTRQTVQDGGPGRTTYVVDFDPASLAALPAEAPLKSEVSVAAPARVEKQQIHRNPHDGARRLVLTLSAPAGGAPVDVQARLLLDGKPVTETWTVRWMP